MRQESLFPAVTDVLDFGGSVVVRETVCRTILNRGELSNYTLNCYTGCTHRCAYCYARFMQRFHPHKEPWGTFVDVKINAVETLKRQLRRLPPGEVFLSSACDGWQSIEAQLQLTRQCCELLIERGFSLSILTKSALVRRDFDYFVGKPVRVGVTLTSLDDRLQQLWEPGASSVSERLATLASARDAGIPTHAMLGPLLPFLTDDQKTMELLLERVADLGVERIWVDALNPRPRVWPAVASLLRVAFPDLLDDYRRMLFDERVRAEYLAAFRGRVASAAGRLHLTDRITACG